MTKVIAIEGLDLSGKTTLAHRINGFYNSRGNLSIYNKGEFNSGFTTDMNEDEMSDLEKELYYSLLTISSNFESEYDFVIQDRTYPTLIYFSEINGTGYLSNVDIDSFPQPDVLIYLGCSYETKVERAKLRENNERDFSIISSRTEHDRRHKIYESIMERIEQRWENVIRVSSDNYIMEDIVEEVNKKIK